MFTGIVESIGKIKTVSSEGSNLVFTIECAFTSELQVDQSVAHDGICLTVSKLLPGASAYQVIAVDETLARTNLGDKKEGDQVNLERSMPANGRFDGHLVQAHIDQIARCTDKQSKNGSWIFSFEYANNTDHFTVEKGSICINGVSLTCFDTSKEAFSVAIIPYTHEHTTFKQLEPGMMVNLEFDIIGKYVKKYLSSG